MNDVLYSNRKAIRNLRVGIVPSSHVLDLTVGINTLKPRLDHEIERVGKTKTKPIIIKGEWGTGKTNLLNYLREYALTKQIVVTHVNLDGRSAAVNHPQRYYHRIIREMRLPGVKGKGLPSLFNTLSNSETLKKRTIKWANSNHYHSELARGFYWLFNGNSHYAIQILLGTDISFADYNYLKVKCINRITEWGKYFKFIGFKGFMIQFDELETIVQLWNSLSRKGAYRVLYQFCGLKNIWPIFATTERLDSQIAEDLVFGNLDDEYARKFVKFYTKNDDFRPPGPEPRFVTQLLKKINKLYSAVYTLPESVELNSIKNRWSKMPFKNYRRLIRLTIDYFDRLRPISDRHYKEIVAEKISKNDFDDKNILTHKEKHIVDHSESEWTKCPICSIAVKKVNLKKHKRKVHERKKVYKFKKGHSYRKPTTRCEWCGAAGTCYCK